MAKRRHKKKRPVPRNRSAIGSGGQYQAVALTTIKLKNVKISGFAAANAMPGEQVPILVRAAITSDESAFHEYMNGIGSLLAQRARETGTLLSFDGLPGYLLIVHQDDSAVLWLNGFPMIAEVLAKRSVKAGEAMFARDIGDVRRVRFEGISFLPTDKIFVCFKIGWKFGLFFDLGDNRDLDVAHMEVDLAALYRRLRYQSLYEALSEALTVAQITKAGWFPFIEILGGDFEPLLKAYRIEFDVEGREAALVASFTSERIDRIAERWWRNPIIAKHRVVLHAGLDAFKRGDNVSCIKNIMTEIEGVLADLHLAEKGSTAKTRKLLEHAVEKGIKKAGGEASLFFPREFLEYLLQVTYANFDPAAPAGAGVSRHTVGHGYADGSTYTPARALQAILTLDQIAFYVA